MKKKPQIDVKKVDHRLLNSDLNFFTFIPEIGSSLPFWLPNGELIKHLLKQYLRNVEQENNFIFVSSPILAKEAIYKKSGHLFHYQKYMFPKIVVGEQNLILRPMTCPHHCLIFKKQNYSYLDLPIRMSENSLLFRYETSGAIHGFERVRQMELKDTHIFLPNDPQLIIQEIILCFQMTIKFLRRVRLDQKIIVNLSINDVQDQEKYHQDLELWRQTSSILEQALQKLGVTFAIKKGEGAFYGPKIDLEIETPLKHLITVSTIQLDFLLAQKFNLKYRTLHQSKAKRSATPIIIHHGIIGTYERLLSLLMEQHNGWLPFWLTPKQVVIFTIFNDHSLLNYAKSIEKMLKKYQIRCHISPIEKRLSENIKIAWTQKIPVHVFIGKKEHQSNKLTYFHFKTSNDKKEATVFQFLDQCIEWKENN